MIWNVECSQLQRTKNKVLRTAFEAIMNRNNFLPHAALAVVLILVAAFAGQVRNWRKHWRPKTRTVVLAPAPTLPVIKTISGNKHSEIFVRFRAGVSETQIRNLTSKLNDEVEDETESVSGLSLIEDEDGQDTEAVLAEYRARPEVEYAEPIFEIHLEE